MDPLGYFESDGSASTGHYFLVASFKRSRLSVFSLNVMYKDNGSVPRVVH